MDTIGATAKSIWACQPWRRCPKASPSGTTLEFAPAISTIEFGSRPYTPIARAARTPFTEKRPLKPQGGPRSPSARSSRRPSRLGSPSLTKEEPSPAMVHSRPRHDRISSARLSRPPASWRGTCVGGCRLDICRQVLRRPRKAHASACHESRWRGPRADALVSGSFGDHPDTRRIADTSLATDKEHQG